MSRRPWSVASWSAVLVLAAGGCGASSVSSVSSVAADDTAAGSRGPVAEFPAGAVPDYQLGGAYEPPADVGLVGRDRTAQPAADAWSICYVNGFQTQPGELDQWPDDVLLRRDGQVRYDRDWPDEALLDTSTPERREQVVDVVEPWITGCADAGFDAVELDNLDTFTRSDGALTLEDNLALAADLVDVAHEAGLAAGQKNAAEFTRQLHERAGFDFAVVEECAAYDECAAYTNVYGDDVVDIEYTDNLPRDFDAVCADPATPDSVVLRDRDLVTPDDPAYVFDVCGE